MIGYAERPIPPSITVRPSPDEKARFAALAALTGLSESALALKAIRTVLRLDVVPADAAAATAWGPATDRITFRLRPADREAIARRAEQRRMKVSTYIAALVRAHFAANPPLAAHELSALKQSVAVLFAVGQFLAKSARAASTDMMREDLKRTRAAVAAVEQRVHDFTKAALISWESRSDWASGPHSIGRPPVAGHCQPRAGGSAGISRLQPCRDRTDPAHRRQDAGSDGQSHRRR